MVLVTVPHEGLGGAAVSGQPPPELVTVPHEGLGAAGVIAEGPVLHRDRSP